MFFRAQGNASYTSGLSTETRAWVGSVNSAATSNVVSQARARLVNELILRLKVGGAWDALDYLWIQAFADENTNEALIDIKSLQAATTSGTGTLDGSGYTGNGTTGFINTGVNMPSHFSTNGVVGGAVLNNRTTAATIALLGINNSITGAETLILPMYTNVTDKVVMEVVGNDYPEAASTTAKGFWGCQRTTSNVVNGYKNGSTTAVLTDASDAPLTQGAYNLYIGAQNNEGVARYFSTDSIVAAYVASDPGASAIIAIHNSVNDCLAGLPTAKNVF